MTLQAVIFDFDGVIADSERAHHRAFLSVLNPSGIDFDYEFYRRYFIGLDDRDAIRMAFGQANRNLDERVLAALVQRKAEYFEGISGEIALNPGIEKLVRTLAARLPIGICSGAVRQDIEAVLAHAGDLKPLFRTIVSADEVAQSKPDPTCYQMAVERLGVDAAYCVAIEDTPAGIDSARGAGLKVVAVTHTCGPARLAKADRLIDNFWELDEHDLNALVAPGGAKIF